MEKSKQMIEVKEEEEKNIESDSGILFQFEEAKKNMVTSLVFQNSDISIYHAYLNQKQYSIVAYFSKNDSVSQHLSSRSKSSQTFKKYYSKPARQDPSLNVIQSFYEQLQSLQGQNTEYSKNMMQILHISRENMQISKSYLSNNCQQQSSNKEKTKESSKCCEEDGNEKDIEEEIECYQNNKNTTNDEDFERDTLLIFFESYERSIEDDIAERSLNQNNILYEEHILESYSDMIDCFQVLGNSLLQHILISSDFLVICREKLTKILPVYNLLTLPQQPTHFKSQRTTINTKRHQISPSLLKNNKKSSLTPILPSNLLLESGDMSECRTRSKTRQLLQNQNHNPSTNFIGIDKTPTNRIQNIKSNEEQQKSQIKTIMTRSALLKQESNKKELDSYTSSMIEVEMACESNGDDEINFEIQNQNRNQSEMNEFDEEVEQESDYDDEFDQSEEQQEKSREQKKIDQVKENKQIFHKNNRRSDQSNVKISENSNNKFTQSNYENKQQPKFNIEGEEQLDHDKIDCENQIVCDDDNKQQNKENQNNFYAFSPSKVSIPSQNINQNKQTQIQQEIQNEKNLQIQLQNKQQTNQEDAFLEVERKALEELSIIYLRLSAFLTAIKFNPHKKNKEMRIIQIINSLIEYKISSLFSDIFSEYSLSLNGFTLSYSTLKEMVNSYRQQKFIIDIAENADLSTLISSLVNKTDIVFNYKDKSLLKLEELESILCSQNSLFGGSPNLIKPTDLICSNNEIIEEFHIQEEILNTDICQNDNVSNLFSSNFRNKENIPDISKTQYNSELLKGVNNINNQDWSSQITSFEFKADLCRLGDEGTILIANILERIPPLQIRHLILSLRRNSISEIGISSIARYVEKCKYLQTFRIFFSYNRIRDAGLASILRSIITLEYLQVLDLRFFDNQITAEGCQGFQDLQDVKFKDIKYLNMSLGNNLIGDEGCRLLSLFLCNVRNVKQLSIFLESNQINSCGIAHLKNVFLRKNQIKYLILHALSNKIEDDGIIKILENIAKLTTLHSLEIILNENSLTEKAGIALGQTIRNMVHLTSLILSVRNNKISNKGVNSIGMNLKNLKNLESLVLSLTNNNIQGDGGVLIGKNLKHLTKLQKLHLVFYVNSINHKSGKAIGEGLSNLKDLNYLILGLGDNNVGDEGAVAIGNCMLNLTKVKIFEIYLQNNEVGSNGARAIARGLQNMNNLKCLVFQIQHSDLGDQPMVELGNSIQNLKQLKSLDIYVERCNIGEEGGTALGQGLSHLQNLKVMVLDLDSNNIGPRGGRALGEAFTNMYGLIDLKLYLKKNNMMPEGGQGLFEGIQYLKKLKSLNIDLYKNYTGDNSIITCGRALTVLKELRNLELSITYNAITQTGAQEFSQYFSQCTTLHEVYLYMQKNNITPQGAEFIGNALSSLKELQQLKISFGNNRIENEGISNVIKGVSKCESLKVLYLYAYNIGMTGEGCVSIASYLKSMKKLERFEFFPSANSQINLKNGLAQIAQSIIENHETLQNVRVDIPYWEEKIKTFIKPRVNNQIQTMQTILFNRLVSQYMTYNPKAIHWDLIID